jgi:hypothetical protein
MEILNDPAKQCSNQRKYGKTNLNWISGTMTLK